MTPTPVSSPAFCRGGYYGIADLLGESRGFGFVKMDTSDDANAAIEKFNGTTQEGKVMTVAHVSLAVLPRQESKLIFRLVVVALVPPLPVATTESRLRVVPPDPATAAVVVAATVVLPVALTGLTSPGHTTRDTVTADLLVVAVSLQSFLHPGFI